LRFHYAIAALIAALPLAAQTPSAITATNYVPPTTQERWHHYFNETLIAPDFYLAVFGSAAIDQITHTPPEWKQGIAGYGRRSASDFGLYAIDGTIHQAASAALGYDPRYIHCGCPGFWHRTGHAVLWTFLTKNSSGQTRFDVPAVGAVYGSSMISTLWYPSRYDPLTDGVREANHLIAYRVGRNIFEEFRADLKHAFHRH
jgi:hypothetical protein